MSKTSKIFRAFGADLRYIPMFYMFFVSKIVVFRSFPWFFFEPAAPETLSTHSVSFRSNKHKSNTTVQNSGSSVGVENHLNIDIQLIRRRRRENFGFLASKTQFSYWKTRFLKHRYCMATLSCGTNWRDQIHPQSERLNPGFQPRISTPKKIKNKSSPNFPQTNIW